MMHQVSDWGKVVVRILVAADDPEEGDVDVGPFQGVREGTEPAHTVAGPGMEWVDMAARSERARPPVSPSTEEPEP